MQFKLFAAATIAAATLSTPVLAIPEPGITTYHVGYDNSEFVNFGAFIGLPNPNYQRLTFLLSHAFEENAPNNHFHRIGSYGYSGDPMAPTPEFSANNVLPEPYQGDDGLSLLAGTGVFSGKLISGLGPVELPADHIEQEYGDTTIAPIDELFAFDGAADPDAEFGFHPGHYLLNASGGAYKQSIAGVTVGMKLVALSPGLAVYDQSAGALWDSVDDVVTLGPGAAWSLDPVFVVDGGTMAGSSFQATFILQDLGSAPRYGDSAEFTFSFITVPEPCGMSGVMAGLAAMGMRRRQSQAR